MADQPGPFNLRVVENCLDCARREGSFFCKLPQKVIRELNAIRQEAFYPRGAVIYAQGEIPRGAYILCSGQVRLVSASRGGEDIILRVAEAGEMLGLSSTISREPHRARAETLSACQVGFISRLQFLQFLRANVDAALRIGEHLSMELNHAWEQIQLVALAPSTHAKLARFLLAWACSHKQDVLEGASLALFMTHEDLAHSIGVSRESVSRALSELREQGLVQFRRGHIVLLRPEVLKGLAAN
jgi:CRP/FNR family cyclic AMP-dependent transcriptional regulator